VDGQEVRARRDGSEAEGVGAREGRAEGNAVVGQERGCAGGEGCWVGERGGWGEGDGEAGGEDG
jgi:hypothetical protein